MSIKRPPLLLRVFAYLNRKIPLVQFGRKILARVFDIQFDRYIRGKGYCDVITLTQNTQIFLWLDEHVDIIIWWQGFYEKFPSRVFKRLLNVGDRVIDVGANIGYYSLLASEIVGPSGRIFSFEPVTKIFDKLLLNSSDHSNITPVQVACGEQGGMTNIYVADDSCSAGSRISTPFENQPAITEQIKLIKLDDYIEDQKIDMVKIDVEGYEIHVLKGMADILRDNLHIKVFIEVNKKLLAMSGSSPEEIFDYLKLFGLTAWQIDYKKRRLELISKDRYWGDENLILFAREEALHDSLIHPNS